MEMNFYRQTHKYYCGVDLHSTSMFVCIVGQDGAILLHRSLPCDPVRFLLAISPFREDLVVAVECVYSWYWLGDLCNREGIAFVLGHALYMKSIHGAKAKSDKIDSEKIAVLLRGGLLPVAYAYPPEMRATRDLMRRRLHFVRQRGALLAHIQITHHQYNVAAPGKRITYRSNREGIGDAFADSSVRQTVAADLALADHYEVVVGDLELAVLRQARIHDPHALALLTSFPGIGKVLALTILYEIHDIARFPTVGDFASYSRLVKCQHSSNGKSLGTAGAKIGNAYLKWAFSEAAVLFVAKSEHGRTVYFMLARQRAFDPQRFAAAA